MIQLTTSTAGSISVSVQGYNTVTLTTCSLNTTTAIAAAATNSNLTITNNMIVTTTAIGVLVTGTAFGSISSSQITALLGVAVQNAATSSFGTSRCDCGSQANSACASVGTIPSLLATTGPSRDTAMVVSGNLAVTNCTMGLSVSAGLISANAATVVSGNALTYGARSPWRARRVANCDDHYYRRNSRDVHRHRHRDRRMGLAGRFV